MMDVTLSAEIKAGTYVVVPAFNEGACLEQVLRELVAVYPNVIVVDDGSSDDTADVAERVACPTCSVI